MRKIMVAPLIVLIAGLACGPVPEASAVDTDGPKIRILFSFNPESYPRMVRKMYPQMAVWAARDDMKHARTIYATRSGAQDRWWGADRRPSALPVWYGIRSGEGPRTIDAVSGATPSGESFGILWSVPPEFRGKSMDVFIEANVSFDYNEHYPKGAKEGDENFSDVNGQPSLVWKARIDCTRGGTTVVPSLAGHGHVLGSDPRIHGDLTKITTAKDIFHYIKVICEAKK